MRSILPLIGNFTAQVNGILTECSAKGVRSFYRTMGAKQILRRIDLRLQVTGQTEHAASKKAGRPDLIRNLRRAVNDGIERGVKFEPMRDLAAVLGTTAQWLINEQGPEDVADSHQMVPVEGKVGAGGEIQPLNDGAIDEIEAPDACNLRTRAVQIEGESLGRIFAGWYALYDDVRDPPTDDLFGKLCLIKTGDGLMYIKRLIKKGRGKRFTLESNYEAPIENVEVIWAAKVKNMVPR